MKKEEIEQSEFTDTLSSILRSIYWPKFTVSQQTAIINIIKDDELSNLEKANEICELLEIEKRGNRKAIAYILIERPLKSI